MHFFALITMVCSDLADSNAWSRDSKSKSEAPGRGGSSAYGGRVQRPRVAYRRHRSSRRVPRRRRHGPPNGELALDQAGDRRALALALSWRQLDRSRGRYLQLDYLYGTGDGQLGGRRTGDGRCARAVGVVFESAASAHMWVAAWLVWWCVRMLVGV